MIDIAKIDGQIKFLHEQAGQVKARNPGQGWADALATRYLAIAETLRQVRQEKQMTGISGKQIS